MIRCLPLYWHSAERQLFGPVLLPQVPAREPSRPRLPAAGLRRLWPRALRALTARPPPLIGVFGLPASAAYGGQASPQGWLELKSVPASFRDSAGRQLSGWCFFLAGTAGPGLKAAASPIWRLPFMARTAGPVFKAKALPPIGRQGRRRWLPIRGGGCARSAQTGGFPRRRCRQTQMGSCRVRTAPVNTQGLPYRGFTGCSFCLQRFPLPGDLNAGIPIFAAADMGILIFSIHMLSMPASPSASLSGRRWGCGSGPWCRGRGW